MANPLVSVVIPAYNEQRYIQRCIDSLLKQSYKNMEVIFIDDGSKDRTREILKAASRKHKHIHFYQRNHGGPGAARNFGAKQAKGSILVFVDADMVFDRRYVEALTKPIRGGKSIGTFHTKELVANKENLWARSWCINRIPDNMKESSVYRAILKKSFLKAGGFDPKKGYFDDDLSSLGNATATSSVCYHNNPETLGEVFRHSSWVGRSLAKAHPRKELLVAGVVISLPLFLVSVALLALGNQLLFSVIVFVAVMSWLFISIKRTIPRIVKEGRWEYLISIPLLWIFRLAGYYFGILQKVTGLRK
jgi:glycosyltransferase involved in cell wall biosynthesis